MICFIPLPLRWSDLNASNSDPFDWSSSTFPIATNRVEANYFLTCNVDR